jgi:hypothetical protein
MHTAIGRRFKGSVENSNNNNACGQCEELLYEFYVLYFLSLKQA